MACVTRKKGRWAVDFYDQFGKRRLKMLPKGATKRKANKLLVEIEEQVNRRIFTPQKDIPTFKDAAADWINYKATNVRESTLETYRGHTQKHFETLNPMKVNHITTVTLEKWITEKRAGGMHIMTLRRVLVTLNQILTYSVRHRYIDHNPLKDTERPRARGEEKKRKGMQILTPDQIKALLDKTKDPKFKMLFMLAVFSGCRQGELLGLKWSDIIWDASQIHIQRSFNFGQFFDVKTEGSDRLIDLGPAVMTELKKWKLACPKYDLNLVFPSKSGTPIDRHHLVARHFAPTVKEAGLPKVRFHDLRHTFASLLIAQGENIKRIQTMLGHSKPTVTLDIYSHLIEPSNQGAAKRLEEAVLA
jgi:integrase